MGMTAVVKGDKLIIEVDISPKAIKTSDLSKSGKNKLLYKTGSFLPVESNIPNLRFNLNVIANDK